MSKISIDLDLAVVQKALHAKVQPAVDQILAGYNLTKMIVAEITKDPAPDTSTTGIMRLMYGGKPPRPLIEEMITDAVETATKDYVTAHIESQRGEIEAAFKRMLAGNSDKLAKAFLASLDGALKDSWSFEISTKVVPKEPDRSDDY